MTTRRALIGGALGVGISLSARSARAAPTAAGDLDRWFRERLTAEGLPGGAAAIARPGRPPHLLTAGQASLPFGVAVTPGTLFHIGSVGKHVTAAAVLRLVDAGRVDLNAGIGRYVAGLPQAWQAAPVATILNHSSGIPDWDSIVWDRPWSRADVLAWARGRALDFAPGAAWSYSNAAFTLLGYLIEEVTGAPYAASVDAMFRAAGLRDARVDDGEAVIAGRAEPYAMVDGVIRHATPMSSTISSVAAGGVLMSARDVPLWSAALWNGSLLSAASMQRMHTPTRLNGGRPCYYNMGWVIDRLPGRTPFLWHTGSVSGFRACHYHDPASGLTMMMAVNADSDAIGAIGLDLIEQVAPGSTPASLPVIADPMPERTALFGALMRREHPADPALFAPEMRVLVERLGADALDDYSEDTPPLSAVDLVQESRAGDDLRRRYRLTVAGRHDFVTVGYTKGGLIYEISSL
ncbi:serine hydrolase [Sphingopyxis sp.]|uniref:serine hydrolase domain-containing protein n=1 Tax=Sphingopyxis sp. TaxID=1908224 RepID=UPI00261FA61F|nr:serine hydrolase domain-containing protein [Sphingopyxis sp.]MCW0197763.1 beta-lactamase family protein [Sphingopyxis sp.]